MRVCLFFSCRRLFYIYLISKWHKYFEMACAVRGLNSRYNCESLRISNDSFVVVFFKFLSENLLKTRTDSSIVDLTYLCYLNSPEKNLTNKGFESNVNCFSTRSEHLCLRFSDDVPCIWSSDLIVVSTAAAALLFYQVWVWVGTYVRQSVAKISISTRYDWLV